MGETRVKATMYNTGGFPCIKLHDDPNVEIVVEVYNCDAKPLQRMDRLEGVSHGMYKRKSIKTEWGPTWIYEWGNGVHRYPVIESGDWKKRNEVVG